MPETTLSKISDHVYWMSPGKPDRPSLCAVVGKTKTLLIDAGASLAHTALFLEALKSTGVPAPDYAVLTHWHWDHVFGAKALGIPIFAHRETARQLEVLSAYDWNDAALDERVATGVEMLCCANDIKQELPEPRSVEILIPDILFDDSLEIHLGGVTCHIQHVGGDHASDSCLIHIPEDRLMVLGDCLYDAIYTPTRHYTTGKLLPLLDTILRLEADQYIEGHNSEVMSRAELEAMAKKMQYASALADRFGEDETTALAEIELPDEDTEYFVRALIAGNRVQLFSV